MIRTENNKTNLLESLSCYPTTIGDIGVKNGLESLLLSNYYSFYLQKKWDKRVAVSNTHNVTSNNKSILALIDEFDIVTLIKLSLQKYGYRVSAFTDPFAALD